MGVDGPLQTLSLGGNYRRFFGGVFLEAVVWHLPPACRRGDTQPSRAHCKGIPAGTGFIKWPLPFRQCRSQARVDTEGEEHPLRAGASQRSSKKLVLKPTLTTWIGTAIAELGTQEKMLNAA